MIYSTKRALEVIKKKFFYLETSDGRKVIIYKQDQAKAQAALKKEKYKLMCSFYSLLDKNLQENNVYLLGVSNKEALRSKLSKILSKEGLNIIESPKKFILFLTDAERAENESGKQGKYAHTKTQDSEWPQAIADKKSIPFLKTKMEAERELFKITASLTKIGNKAKQGAKDDSEVLEMKRKKMNADILAAIEKTKSEIRVQDWSGTIQNSLQDVKELEKYLPKGTLLKLTSLKSTAENFQKMGDTNVKVTDFDKLKGSLKSFFNDAKSMLKTDNPMTKHIEDLVTLIDAVKSTNDVSKMVETINQINAEAEKIKG